MMDRTNRHCRYLLRRLSRRVLLYTEMVTTGALIHGDRERHLAFSPEERPLVLQLGGDDPEALARCAHMAQEAGYDEVNLNVGCPSDRVQRGRFGVCLMGHPQVVADCVAAMRQSCDLPVGVKHRIGFDDQDTYEHMRHFVEVVAAAGCDRFVVHARKAWLQGLSPKQNRNIPPLRHEDVRRLKAELPALRIECNGGIRTLAEVSTHAPGVDGVMIGRAAWDTPWLLADVDQRVYGQSNPVGTRHEAVRAMLPYIEERLAAGDRLHPVTRPMLMLFHSQPGGKNWRRHLSAHATGPGAGVEVVEQALALVPR
jgi:tRNA-dihydrouridine synthase A